MPSLHEKVERIIVNHSGSKHDGDEQMADEIITTVIESLAREAQDNDRVWGQTAIVDYLRSHLPNEDYAPPAANRTHRENRPSLPVHVQCDKCYHEWDDITWWEPCPNCGDEAVFVGDDDEDEA
jgi:hypothetical protein